MSACGAIVDYIKFPYRATFRYADGGTFDAYWYECNPGAQNMPFPTAFGSSSFDPTRFDQGQIGELPQVQRPTSVDFLAPWLVGDHVCGSEDQWQNGFPINTPFIPVGAFGVPLCCGLPDGPGGAFDAGFDFGFEVD